MIPASPDEITAGWLAEAFRSTDVLGGTAISAVHARAIGDAASYTGQVVRLYLYLDPPTPRTPSTIIAKLPPADRLVREAGAPFRPAETEAAFYRDLAPANPLGVPRRYFHARDERTGRSILLLEDLAPARVLDQRIGCPPPLARLALEAVAQFHGAWCGQRAASYPDWLIGRADARAAELAFVDQLYGRAWPHFRDRWGEMLPRRVRAMGDHMVGRVAEATGH